jgi:ABC-type cobalamin/Fe3+-siderophores transport system ATPase subunit
MLNNLTTRHGYPGKLFVVEGIDGSGKSTQLQLAKRHLEARGLALCAVRRLAGWHFSYRLYSGFPLLLFW